MFKMIESDVPSVPTRAINKCISTNYYGLLFPEDDGEDDCRAFVIRDGSYSGNFCMVWSHQCTNGNGIEYVPRNVNLREFLSTAIKKGFDVYEFETFKELTDWINK